MAVSRPGGGNLRGRSPVIRSSKMLKRGRIDQIGPRYSAIPSCGPSGKLGFVTIDSPLKPDNRASKVRRAFVNAVLSLYKIT